MKKALLITGVTIAFLVLCMFGGIWAVKTFFPYKPVVAEKASAPKELPLTRANLLKLVNDERKNVGVAPLKEDSRLDTSAQRKADDEQKYNYFAHISPHDGKHGYEYINDVGIYCKTDSENLVENLGHKSLSATQAVDAWMNSKPHRDAMLNVKYSLTGFGVINDAVVEHFCQP